MWRWIRYKEATNFPRPSLISAFKWEKYLHIGLRRAGLNELLEDRTGLKIGERMKETMRGVENRLEAVYAKVYSDQLSFKRFVRTVKIRAAFGEAPSSFVVFGGRNSVSSYPSSRNPRNEASGHAAIGVSTYLNKTERHRYERKRKGKKKNSSRAGRKNECRAR